MKNMCLCQGKISYPLVLVFLFQFSNCASLLLEEKIPEQKSYTYHGVLTYELYGWLGKSDAKHANTVLRKLHELNLADRIIAFQSRNHLPADYLLQIIYEDTASLGILLDQPEQPVSHRIERNSKESIIYFINRIISFRTFLLFPTFKREQDKILFRIWKQNTLIQEKSCSIDHLNAFGWLPLIVKPFDDKKEIESRYASCVYEFSKEWTSIHRNGMNSF